MYNYKCDRCGVLVYIDPGEERICEACRERMRSRKHPAKITYHVRDKEVQYAG